VAQETLLFTDFDVVMSSVQINAILNTTALALVDDASLQIYRVSGGSVSTLTMAPKAGKRQATTIGQLRVLLKHTVGGSTSQQFGLVCMQSQRNIQTTGSAYLLRVRGENLDLCKLNGTGLIGSPPSQLATAAGVVPFNTTHAIQLQWTLDLAQLGGVQLRAWRGSALDYSNLIEVAAYTDLVSPLTTTVTEGVFAIEGFGGAFTVLMDMLSLEGI